jgi:hypothetical protein
MLVDERLDWMMQRKRETPLTTLLGVRPAYRFLLPDTPLRDSTFVEDTITLAESHESITQVRSRNRLCGTVYRTSFDATGY